VPVAEDNPSSPPIKFMFLLTPSRYLAETEVAF
jgi:hypothetical protein